MSDIGELVVRLTMDNGGLERGIKASQRALQNQQSDFRANAATAGGFGDKMKLLGDRSKSLAEQVRLAGDIVDKYRQKKEKANKRLDDAREQQGKLNQKYAESQRKVTDLTAEVGKAEEAYKASIKAEGENAESTVALGVAYENLKDQLSDAKEESKGLKGQLATTSKTIVSAGDQLQYAEGRVNQAREAQEKLTKELKEANAAARGGSAVWKEYGESLSAAGEKITKRGKALTTAITAPLVAAGTLALKSSIDFESAFAGVRKTVDATEAEYDALSRSVRNMSKVLPTGADAIAEVMEMAGQLGIKKDALEGFTRTMVDLGEATNLTGTEGAESLAKFANVTQMSQKEFDRLGSTLVALGNNSATTEKDIMDMAMRLAGAGSQIGLSQDQILAFAASLSSVGIEAQAGGSAFSKMMVGMQLAVETGKDGLQDFARVAGMSASEFQAAFQRDAAGALQSFIVGLSKMDEEGVSAIKTLDDMGISEVRLRDTLLRATNANELFDSSLKLANAAWKDNTALTKEAAQRYGTTASKLKILKNQAVDAARTLGDDMKPAADSVLDSLSGMIEKYGELDEGTRKNIIKWGAFIAGIGPGTMVIGKANKGVGTLIQTMSNMAKKSAEAGGGLKGMFSAATSGLGPAGWAALALAVGAAGMAFYDYASGAKAAREAVEKLNGTAKDWQNTQAQTIYDSGMDPFERFSIDGSLFGGAVEMARKDVKALERLDKEIAKLQSKDELTEREEGKLNDALVKRVQIRMEYAEDGENGYEEIITNLNAQLNRAANAGIEVPDNLFGDALNAIAQGRVTEMSALDSWYDQQFADIEKITDKEERLAQLEKLNTEYAQERTTATQEYVQALGKVRYDALNTDVVQQGKADFEALQKAIEEFKGAGEKGDPIALEALISDMDEGDITSYLGVLTQLQAAREDLLKAGTTEDQATSMGFPDFSDTLAQFESLTGYLNTIQGQKGVELEGAKGIATAIEDELGRLSDTLGIQTSIEVTKYTPAENAIVDPIAASVNEYRADPDAAPPEIKAAITAFDNIASDKEKEKARPLLDALINEYLTTDGSEASKKRMLEAWDAYISELYTNDETKYPDVVIPARIKIDEGTMQGALDSMAQRSPGYFYTEAAEKLFKEISEAGNNFMPGGDWQRNRMYSGYLDLMAGNDGDNGQNSTVTFLQGVNDKLQSGEELAEEYKAQLDLLSSAFAAVEAIDNPELTAKTTPYADALGVKPEDLPAALEAMKAQADEIGKAVVDGVNAGMENGDMTTGANAMAGNVDTALRDGSAFDINSPSGLTEPIGASAGEGVGKGMRGYNFGGDALKTAGNTKTALALAMLLYQGSFTTIGSQIAAGVGEEMGKYNFDGYAEKMVSNIQTSIEKAAGIASPAKRFMPDGRWIAAGEGVGMTTYDFTKDATTTTQHIKDALRKATGEQILVPNYVAMLDDMQFQAARATEQAAAATATYGGDHTETNYTFGDTNFNGTQVSSDMDVRRMVELADEERRRKAGGMGG